MARGYWSFKSNCWVEIFIFSSFNEKGHEKKTYVHRLSSSIITVLLSVSLYIYPHLHRPLVSLIPRPKKTSNQKPPHTHTKNTRDVRNTRGQRHIESGMMRKRSSSGSSGSVSSRVQRSQEVMPLHPQHNYPYQQQLSSQQQQQQQQHYAAQVVMHHGGPGGAVAAAGRLVRQTSRDSNDGSLHSVSSESSS
jgi:hypothetical protein